MSIPHIKNAFHNIKTSCELKLKQQYPISIPEIAQERLEKELSFLENSKYLDDFEILRIISEEARKSNCSFSLKGTLPGSYIAFLLRDTLLDPLPPYYYCPVCGHFEIIDTRLFGIDLPKITCPDCQSSMISNGYHLSIESVWGLDGKKTISFEYNICSDFIPFIKCALEKIYPDNTIAPLGMLTQHANDNYTVMEHCGFLILPNEYTMDDYPDLLGYFEDGEACLTANLQDVERYGFHRISLLQNPMIETLITMQKKTGLYIRELSNADISSMTWNDIMNTGIITPLCRNLFTMCKPNSFTSMVSTVACSHASYQGITPVHPDTNYYEIYHLLNTSEFGEYPYTTREDFYEGALKIGFPKEKAFEFSEFVQKGKAASDNSSLQQKLEDYHLPSSLKNVAQKYRYLFPRAHCAEYTIIYAQLAFYRKKNNRAYSYLLSKNHF
ncbi:MAG: hypothetical protein Q4B70_04435 [Lachnospiraceae bacterium]|nr:hypothetical protein [Lachnospiraceae bacterium]